MPGHARQTHLGLSRRYNKISSLANHEGRILLLNGFHRTYYHTTSAVQAKEVDESHASHCDTAAIYYVGISPQNFHWFYIIIYIYIYIYIILYSLVYYYYYYYYYYYFKCTMCNSTLGCTHPIYTASYIKWRPRGAGTRLQNDWLEPI